MKASTLKRLFSWYGPYLGAGVKMEHLDPNFRHCRVSMRLRWYNKNAVSTHFGGSLYSMVDPHYMLLVMKSLGKDYTVWDKSAAIEFIRPGKGYVWAEFHVNEDMLDDIRKNTEDGNKYCPTYTVNVMSEDNKVVCKVDKTLYIKRMPQQGRRI